ncbi:MAG TPA: response regulator [Candidatus Omnitrophota bacterium]|nr:response regulator [Candidatus Omnitrophota bacterium]
MNRATVLVVEDEPRLRFIIERQLSEAGFDVLSEESGEAALKTLGTQIPDLVLVNILLIGMDGIEVCKRIRGDLRLAHVPVIVLTARTDGQSRRLCLAAGGSDYIPKPWRGEDLISRIRGAIAASAGSRNTERS